MIRDIKPELKQAYPDVYTGTADLYCYFYARALQLLRSGGVFCFISSNKWLRADYGQRLRAHLASNCRINSITDFGDLPVFQDVTAYPVIIVATLGDFEGSFTYTQVPSLLEPYPDVLAVTRAHGRSVQGPLLGQGPWAFAGPEDSVVDRIRDRGESLRSTTGTRVYRGLTTGLNAAFELSDSQAEALFRFDSKNEELIKPLILGRDIKRWSTGMTHRWLIVTKMGTQVQEYRAIYNHLKTWEYALEQRHDKGNHWWELRACTYYDTFSCPKILSTKVSIRPTFALDTSGAYLGNTAYFFPVAKDAEFLLGVLNSSVFYRYSREVFVEKQNGWYELQPKGIEEFTIPAASEADKSAITALVRKCIETKGVGCEAWEQEIDERVEFLYFHRHGDETYEEGQARLAAEAAGEVGALRKLMGAGEDQTVEFKSSVLWDVRQDKHSTVMRDEVLKEICAFLNAGGGTLLCGVDDAGKVLGLRKDLKHAGNRDKLGLQVTNPWGELLRPNPVELVRLRWVEIDGETVLRIDITGDPSQRYESLFDKKMKTFVRVEGSARVLEGQDLINWWDRRRKLGGAGEG